MVIVAKRTILSLYSNEKDIYSHQVRIVLAEKGVSIELHSVKDGEQPEDLLDINPYGTIPTLVNRDLVLYEDSIINEYLDERFPHPPLMPVYPVSRAEVRKMLHRIEKDWYSLYHTIQSGSEEKADAARTQLRDTLTQIAPVFADKPFFLSTEYSLLDCAIAPFLWRLPQLGIELPESAAAVNEYAQRIFDRSAFRASLTDFEKELHAA